MSDTPKSDQIWREYWEQFPQEENRTPTGERIFFGLKLKDLERENARLREALERIAVFYRGGERATESMLEMRAIAKRALNSPNTKLTDAGE